MSAAQTHGAGELRNTELEEQQSPLALFSKQIEDCIFEVCKFITYEYLTPHNS